jgi:ribosome-associated translation inhibitor RaiA
MPVVDATTTEVSHKGDVRDSDVEYATGKIRAVADTCRERVHHIEVRLVLDPDRGRERPAQAEAALDIDGRTVRAHVAASTVTEATDLLVDRLNRRVRRHEERRHRMDTRHRHDETSWRHGDLPAQRPEFVDIPADEREVVKRKTFAWGPMSLDEAAFELDHLAHDFYLFEHADSGRDAALCHGEDDLLILLHPDGAAVDLDDVVAPIELSTAVVPSMTEAEARESLDASGRRWLFHLDADSGRGRIMYRRFDGNYGLILPT